MRYPAEHKDQTRGRILGAAAKSFRRRGGEGIGIAELMKDLALTHGGFYRHFDSKEQLFGESLASSLHEMAETLERAGSHGNREDGLRRIIEAYLSPKHCANPAEGCPVAVLGAEVPRHSEAVRKTFDTAMRQYVRRLETFMPGKTQAERRRNFLVLFGGMAGTLTLARAMDDAAARREVLRAARDFYIASFCEC